MPMACLRKTKTMTEGVPACRAALPYLRRRCGQRFWALVRTVLLTLLFTAAVGSHQAAMAMEQGAMVDPGPAASDFAVPRTVTACQEPAASWICPCCGSDQCLVAGMASPSDVTFTPSIDDHPSAELATPPTPDQGRPFRPPNTTQT